MSKRLFHFFVIVIAFSFIACKNNKMISLHFSNPLEIARTGEVISLGNNELTELTGEFPENSLPLFISGSDTLTVQFIDLDGDLSPEEILVEISLGPREVKNVQVKFIPSARYPEFPKKTNIRFARKSDASKEIMVDERLQTSLNTETAAIFQMEGPAWENDKVGFRNYFDLRNGMDIFGKTTSEMVLDGVGLGDNYHALADWGMDILKVGNSLGAGSIGVEYNDVLYRIGDNERSVFERVIEGPLRSEYRFVFPQWNMGSEKIHITQYISITAGQYAYKSSVFSNALPEGAHLISGIVTMLTDKVYSEDFGDFICLFTHDRQTENKDYLSMALLLPKEYYSGSAVAPDSGPGIVETYYGKMKPGADQEVEFMFYSLWEMSDKGFANIEYVKAYLKNEALMFSNPINISASK